MRSCFIQFFYNRLVEKLYIQFNSFFKRIFYFQFKFRFFLFFQSLLQNLIYNLQLSSISYLLRFLVYMLRFIFFKLVFYFQKKSINWTIKQFYYLSYENLRSIVYILIYQFVNQSYYNNINQQSMPPTVHQQYQPTPTTISTHRTNGTQRPLQLFPDVNTNTQQIDTLKNIVTVLSQALSTKDQQTVKQLLITANDQVIKNTLQSLGVSRAGALLQAIQVIIIQQTRNMNNVGIVTKWLKQLLKRNIGHIVNNSQLQVVCARISKQLQKRQSLLPKLINLQQSIPKTINNTQNNMQPQSTKYVPKFNYVQEEHELQHVDKQQNQAKKQDQSKISDIGPEDLENLDQMLAEDDIDFDM